MLQLEFPTIVEHSASRFLIEDFYSMDYEIVAQGWEELSRSYPSHRLLNLLKFFERKLETLVKKENVEFNDRYTKVCWGSLTEFNQDIFWLGFSKKYDFDVIEICKFVSVWNMRNKYFGIEKPVFSSHNSLSS